jgi:Reverse transcriptase (RNA-dependent DNA polymerase)
MLKLVYKKRKKQRNKSQSLTHQVTIPRPLVHLSATLLPQINNVSLPHQREPTIIQLQHFGDLKMIYHVNVPSEENLPIVFDTGASASVTPLRSDFVHDLTPSTISALHGLKGQVDVVGSGLVQWTIVDLFGTVRTIQTMAHFVPEAKIRLFSPQVYFQENNGGYCELTKDKIKLTLPEGTELEFPYNAGSNIPLMLPFTQTTVGLTMADVSLLSSPELLFSHLSVADETNQNLTSSQKELLKWHWRLGHANMQWIQHLLSSHPSHADDNEPRPDHPILRSQTPKSSSCLLPLCAACQMAKQTRRNPSTNPRPHLPENDMILRRDDVDPGAMVSIDQYISTVPGRLPHTKGKEQKKDRYVGGTLFVDHGTAFVYIKHQVSLRSGDTVRSKRAFEQYCSTFGIKVLGYHADNVPFGSKEFRADLTACDQSLTFSGTGAHHQNGVAERAIRTIVNWSRAMLLHMVIHWPAQADLALWPFAMEYATYIWNHLPRKGLLLSPVELLSRTKFHSYDFLRRTRVWGCPTYVLDPTLQDGKKLPKWRPRARRGQFLGFSTEHSSTIGRILNLTTGYISPQYHVVYDDLFTTVASTSATTFEETIGFPPDQWETLLTSGYDRHEDLDDAAPLELHDEWLSPAELAERHQLREARRLRRRILQTPLLVPEGAQRPPLLAPEGAIVPPLRDDADQLPHNQALDDLFLPPDNAPNPEPPAPPLTTLRRSTRHIVPPRRYVGEEWANYQINVPVPQKIKASCLNSCYLNSLRWDKALDQLQSTDLRHMMSLIAAQTDVDHNTVEWMHPMILAAKANSEDTPRWEEAMNGPNKAGYWEAMRSELATLTGAKDAWDVVDRADWMHVLPSTWAFRCKRYPDGTVRKLKARFCVRGDRQLEGVDYFDTFAPVVNWITVRLMLVLSILLDLSTKQIDYTAAFVHAPIDRDPNWDNLTAEQQQRSGVYISMPRGFTQDGKVLKLKKSLYGLKQSPRNFFQFLKSKLERVGFKSIDDIDPCLFVSPRVICLVYVDDTFFYSPKEAYIDEVILQLREQDMDLEVEGEVAGFLGVHIKRNDDKTIMLSQPGLTQRIIDALNVQHLPVKHTPCTSDPLVKDDDGDPPNGTYSYSSVVGMLQYLQNHSRPDITFAVSQCARFVHNPRRSHERALEHIGQYLKGTVDRGLLLQPNNELTIDCYVDADFAGLWPHEDRTDPVCVKSRTGFVICISNCPVIWGSKLQHEISTSTMEAEYNALSYTMRELLPFKTLVLAVAECIGFSDDDVTTIRTTVWEDNAGALSLANLEPGRSTPRSKFYAIKMHWFRSKLEPNNIQILKIDTAQQKADIFTKGLQKIKFFISRKLLCGW